MKLRRYTILIITVLLLAVLCVAVACEKHTHSYEWKETTAPTCEGEGVETGTCSCGNVTTRPVSPVGHEWNEYVVTEIPTADATGTVTATCKTDASHIHSASLPVLSASVYTVTPDGKDYNVEYSIDILDEVTGAEGQTVSFIVCVHEHSYEWETVVESTCLAEGKKKGTCSHELCDEVIEESIAKMDHLWNAPTIVVAPTEITDGSAVVTCAYDNDGNHTREYVLPAINTLWKNHSVEGDEKECLYTGYVATVSPEDDTVYIYTLSIYDPFQGYDCGPQDLTVTIEVSTTDHVHVYGEYEIERMPTGNSAGSAVCHCIVPEHTHTISLPSFNNNLATSINYTYETVDGIVNWSIERAGNNGNVTFSGSYEIPSTIAIKTSGYPTSTLSEEYNDGDTIEMKVGDYASTIIIVTPLGGKNVGALSMTCVDEDGNVVKVSRDMMLSTAISDLGILLDSTVSKNGYTLYVKDFCPKIHYLTLDAGNGLTSTFTIVPKLNAPSGKGANALKPQTYNVKQQAWNNVNETPSVYIGANLIVAAGSGIYIDPSSTIAVFNSANEDVTESCIIGENKYSGKLGFIFASTVEGTYTIELTSTRTEGHKTSFNVEVMGFPNPSELFDDAHYYIYSTSDRKYTVEYSNIVNDDEAGTSSGTATLTVETKGTVTIPFTYEFAKGVCTFTAPSEVAYNLLLNNNYELAVSYIDEFEEIEVEYTLDKIALFNNSLVGTYTFAYNPDTESSEMKLIVTVNQSGVYKLAISGGILCVNINHTEVYDYLHEYDFYVGKFGGGTDEKLVTLYEGDEIMLYNQSASNSTLAITLEEKIVDNFSGDYAFDAENDRIELEVNVSGTYKFTIDTMYVVVGINKDEDPSFEENDGMVGIFVNLGSNVVEIELSAGDKVVIYCPTGSTCNLTIEKA